MTISRVGSATAEASSVTLPAHQAGDLLIICAYRQDSNTLPTPPAGWIIQRTSSGGANSLIVGWKIAESDSEVSGTWTNATMIGAVVYRDDTNYLVPGSSAVANSAGSTSVSYAGIFMHTNNTAWVLGFVGGGINTTNFEDAPTGMTNFANIVGASVGELAMHDSNTTATSFGNKTVTIGSSSKYATITMDIRDSGIPKASGGGGGGDDPGRLIMDYLQ